MMITILAFALIAALDVPSILQKKEKKAIIVYCVLFAAVFAYAILAALMPTMNSPLFWLSRYLRDVIGLSY